MNKILSTSRENIIKNRFILANLILIALMVTALVFTFQQAIEIFAINYNGAYLPFLGLIIAFVTLNSNRKTREMPILSKESIARHIAEWVVILVMLKLVIYLSNDPAQLIKDFPTWGNDFFKNFFTQDYITAIVISLLSAGIALLLGQPIGQLEEDKALMDQEKLGYTFNDRTNARKVLISTIFLLGGLQLFLTAIIRSNVLLPGLQTNPNYRLVLALILYFLFGFLLLALNQYNLQKARWYLSEVKVENEVAHRWLVYCIILITLVTLISLFLPTKYIIGVFPAIRFLWNVLVYVFNWLSAFVFLPILVFLRIFGKEGSATEGPTDETAIQEPAPFFNSTEAQALNQTGAWFDIVKSVVFWVFLGILIFITLKYYLGQKKAWRDFVSNIHFFAWFRSTWKSVKNWLSLVKNKSIRTIKESANAIRGFFVQTGKGMQSSSDYIQRLPMRLSIISAYVDLRTWLNSNGFPIKKALTPHETQNLIIESCPDSRELMETVTTLFIKARYTTYALTKSDASQMQKGMLELKNLLLNNNK